jgi:hypothetical protein
MRSPHRRRAAAIAAGVGAALAAGPPPALAFNPLKAACHVMSAVAGMAPACAVATHPEQAAGIVQQAASGNPGAAATQAVSLSTRGVLDAVGLWAIAGARSALRTTGKVLSATTRPAVTAGWFLQVYRRVGGVAALLTLPFLAAAAVQAVLAGDVGLLARSSLQYLPLSLIGVGIAAPLTSLLLSATDELSATVSRGADGTEFLVHAAAPAALTGAAFDSPFLTLLIALLVVAGAIALWIELVFREAAVYVIVLMLPLAFAAFVWPARRIWAIRAVELLVSLVLSKFVIVAVLSLGAAALDHLGSGSALGGQTLGAFFAGGVLVMFASFAPWAILRFVPLAELAGTAAGSLRAELHGSAGGGWRRLAGGWGGGGGGSAGEDAADEIAPLAGNDTAGVAVGIVAGMRRDAAEWLRGRAGSGAPAGSSGGPAASNGGAPDTGAGRTGTGDGLTDSGGDPASAPESRDGRTEHDLQPPAPRERLPGLGPLWQLPDLSWNPITLGLDEGWPPSPAPQPGAAGAGRHPDGDSDDVLPERPEPPEGRL